jgi:hypothetical protein
LQPILIHPGKQPFCRGKRKFYSHIIPILLGFGPFNQEFSVTRSHFYRNRMFILEYFWPVQRKFIAGMSVI